MNDTFVCKIPSIEEMNIKWNYEIDHSTDDKSNWITWKKQNIESFQKGYIIPYYGVLNKTITCEATAMINAEIVQNSDGLVGADIAYLSAFRTIDSYQGKGYFSKLMEFMLEDLKRRGYKKVTLGVEPTEVKNKSIYTHYGFTEYIKSATETYPDGTVICVEYYAKTLESE